MGLPHDGHIESLGYFLQTLERNVFGMSWGPIFAGWAYTNTYYNMNKMVIAQAIHVEHGPYIP